MEDDPFTDFIERGLRFEESYGAGGSTAMREKEDLAWSLYEKRSGTGGLLLGDLLLSRRVSYTRHDLNTVPFAKALVEENFKIVDTIQDKDQWDWYYLGIAHEFGRGTNVDHGKAADCFRQASELNNPYAEFEEIWSKFLSDKNLIEAINRFRAYNGRLETYAKKSADSLSLLALGPSRNIGSYEHAWRILEISKLLSPFLYHDSGKRFINIAVEAEMRYDLDQLRDIKSSASAFVLYIISKSSRKNPTNEKPFYWFKLAATCNSPQYISMIKIMSLYDEEWDFLSEMCLTEEWKNSVLAEYIKNRNETMKDDYEYL